VHPIQAQFGRVLRRRREAAGHSQEELAARAGLHRNLIGLLERGEQAPNLLTVWQLTGALDTTMADLLGEVERSGE
jgi:transcriptional regulator with XRE-family HTH domain